MEDLMSTGEAAKVLGMTPQRVWQLIKEKKIQGARKVGKCFVIPTPSLSKYIEGRVEERFARQKRMEERKEGVS